MSDNQIDYVEMSNSLAEKLRLNIEKLAKFDGKDKDIFSTILDDITFSVAEIRVAVHLSLNSGEPQENVESRTIGSYTIKQKSKD